MSNRKEWYRDNHPKSSMVRNVIIWVLVILVALIVVLGGYFLFGNKNTKPVSLDGLALQTSQPQSKNELDNNTGNSAELVTTGDESSSETRQESSSESAVEIQPSTETKPVETPKPSNTPNPTESSAPVEIAPIPARDYAVVVLDPGHGGKDGGCDVTVDGVMYREKDIDLAVALLVKDYLEEKDDIKVYMTRDTDVFISLDKRPMVGNDKQADLFVSLHCNSFTKSTTKGLECYSHDNSKESGKVSEKLISHLKSAGLDTKIRGSRTADYKVLRESYYNAVLFEMGFMTCPEELEMLISEDYQKKLAKALADAIYSVVKK